jgi:hypothetical protein
MKPCKGCGTEDPSNFYETQGSRWCRPCFGLRYVAPGRERLLQAKLARGSCVDCGLPVTAENAVCFDFDHIGDDKRFNVSKMMTCAESTFRTEIAKCEMVCSNDHRIRTKTRGRRWKKGGRPRTTRCVSPPTPPQSSQ